MRQAKWLYDQWKAGQPTDEAEVQEEARVATTTEEAEEAARKDIEAYLERMNPYDFQSLVAGLLEGMGYHVDWIAPPGPDKGIDIIAYVDPLGVTGPCIKAQVKKKADKVTLDGVRSFKASIGDADIGLFISSGEFTRKAEAFVRFY